VYQVGNKDKIKLGNFGKKLKPNATTSALRVFR
jgi:hypothetical protein